MCREEVLKWVSYKRGDAWAVFTSRGIWEALVRQNFSSRPSSSEVHGILALESEETLEDIESNYFILQSVKLRHRDGKDLSRGVTQAISSRGKST